MELLILSKLKWDLTAITAYDYLDHLLDAVTKRTEADDCTSRQLKSLRRQTERLVTLCATDPHFLSLPPSMVASASLASAVQLDFESQPTANLNHIFEKLRTVARIEMVSSRHCCTRVKPACLFAQCTYLPTVFYCRTASVSALSRSKNYLSQTLLLLPLPYIKILQRHRLLLHLPQEIQDPHLLRGSSVLRISAQQKLQRRGVRATMPLPLRFLTSLPTVLRDAE